MKHPLFLLPLLFIACTTETEFVATIENASDVTYDEATINVLFEVPKNNYNTHSGLYYGLDPNPDAYDEVINHSILNPSEGEVSFELSDLIAEETYHARAFIQTEDGNINISSNYSFTTSSLPTLSCSLGSQTLDVDGTTYSTDPIAVVQNSGDYILTSETDLGNISFYFWNEPTSGIYKTTDSENFIAAGQMVAKFWLSTAPICEYRADEWQDIQVMNNNGNFTVEFCDLDVSKINLGSCVFTKVLSGRFSM